MKLDRETMKKMRQLIVFTLVVLVALWRLDVVMDGLGWVFGLLFPFLVGAAMAFVMNVPMRAMEKKLGLKRYLSLPLTLVFLVGIVLIVLFLVIPELGRTVMVVGENIPDAVMDFQTWIVDVFDQNPQMAEQIAAQLNNLVIDWDSVVQGVWNFLRVGAGNVLSTTVSAAMSLFSAVTTFFISFVFCIYILLSKERLGEQTKKLLAAFMQEKRAAKVLQVGALSHRTFSNFISGQCLEAVILGVLFFVAMSICRMPYVLMISVLIAFTALIPIFGAFIGCAVGAFLILVTNPIQAVGFVVLFLVLQQVEGNLIYPHVVGNSVGLPSIWVLVAVTLGGSTMGIVGMLIFIPLCSVLYSLLRDEVNRRLAEKARAPREPEAAPAKIPGSCKEAFCAPAKEPEPPKATFCAPAKEPEPSKGTSGASGKSPDMSDEAAKRPVKKGPRPPRKKENSGRQE